MAAKLSIKIDTTVYRNGDYRRNEDRNALIKSKLGSIFDSIHVPVDRYFVPTYESIKVIIRNEADIDKVFTNVNKYTDNGFEPRLSMALRASLTVFISGYDVSLTQMHDANHIKQLLTDQGWLTTNVYILQSKKAFKIQMKNKAEVNRFLEMNTVVIGNIQIAKKNIDKEVNPIIPQCWGCGKIQPGHNKDNCRHKVCMKCNSNEHEFPQCNIPKNHNEMTIQQKAKLFCVPCNTTGDHSSLDHRACPTKRKIVQERIKESRKQRDEEDQKLEKEKQTMKKAFEYVSNEFPQLPQVMRNGNSSATLITLALLEEAVSPGCFQEKMDKLCEENNMEKIIYKPDRKTANAVFNAICTPLLTPEHATNITDQRTKQTANRSVIKVKTSTHNRWLNDTRKRPNDDGSEDEGMNEEPAVAAAAATIPAPAPAPAPAPQPPTNQNKKPKSNVDNIKLNLLANAAANEANFQVLENLRSILANNQVILSDPSVKEGNIRGVRNMTVKEALTIMTSNACKNEVVWKSEITNDLNRLIVNNCGDCMVSINYISYPEAFFQKN